MYRIELEPPFLSHTPRLFAASTLLANGIYRHMERKIPENEVGNKREPSMRVERKTSGRLSLKYSNNRKFFSTSKPSTATAAFHPHPRRGPQFSTPNTPLNVYIPPASDSVVSRLHNLNRP